MEAAELWGALADSVPTVSLPTFKSTSQADPTFPHDGKKTGPEERRASPRAAQ